METTFRSKKEQRRFSSERELQAAYGGLARKIMQRMKELQAAATLADISHLPPPRCHELDGNRKGTFSVDLSANMRLLFRPSRQPPPTTSDGGIDLARVDAVQIQGVEDTHEGKNRR